MLNAFQQIRSSQAHELYHEAQRRAQLPQPVTKYRKPKSLLMAAPNNVIFELFNTIIMEIPNERLVEFVTLNLRNYLLVNWASSVVQQMIRRLRREQAIDVRAGLSNAPVIKFATGAKTSRAQTTIIDVRKAKSPSQISPSPPGSPPASSPPGSSSAAQAASPPPVQGPGSPSEPRLGSTIGSRISTASPTQRPTISTSSGSAQRPGSPLDARAHQRRQSIINQVYEHVMWRIQTDNVTQVASLLIKLAIDDGYKRGKLKSEPYEDVWPCFEEWRGQKLIKLYAFGCAPIGDQKLVLTSTTAGDLTKWVANYIDGSEKRQRPEHLRILAASLRDKSKNCIFITNELIDAIRSIESGSVRCALLVDRLNRYEPVTSMPNFATQIEPLILSGKLFVVSNLACVEFAPDPTSDNCC